MNDLFLLNVHHYPYGVMGDDPAVAPDECGGHFQVSHMAAFWELTKISILQRSGVR
jgi:hypothetical protein